MKKQTKKGERVQLGVRVSPKLDELLKERSSEEGISKSDLVEELLWAAIALDNPDEDKLPPIFQGLIEKIGAELKTQLKEENPPSKRKA